MNASYFKRKTARKFRTCVRVHFRQGDICDQPLEENTLKIISSRSSQSSLYLELKKKNSLANMKDGILDFSFTSFNLSRCQIPLANSNVWSPLRTYRGPVPLPSSYLFLRDLFSLTRTRLRLLLSKEKNLIKSKLQKWEN